ncbi:MAG: glycerol-3-phosphate dehydrogenase [Nitrococcus sp.]|nr:glycerol-3-phosphate dehydrogenase [Nitrococcus sp.]
MSAAEPYDLLVIGAGINGAGIARDAAGRGLRVLLCEQADVASYTSSASTKLIHGGLRYLQNYEFSLVTKALREREILLRNAPHIIAPLRIVMPHTPSLRPGWMIRAGLMLYDHLGGRKQLLGPSEVVDLRWHVAGRALTPRLAKGFVYSDCRVQDSRLVVLNAMDAAQRGASVWLRTRCLMAEPHGRGWRAVLRCMRNATERVVYARVLVNATGPWASSFLAEAVTLHSAPTLRLVQGSHIVVPKHFRHDCAYLFQNDDGRIVFAIPYERDFTLIGTTEAPYQGEPAEARASEEEISYLCRAVNRYFRQPIQPETVVWTYSGVRPLYDEREEIEVSAASRDYSLDLRMHPAPLLSVLGGKLTTYRLLAHEAMRKLAAVLGCDETDWTIGAPLPGGDIADADFDGFQRIALCRYPWLPPALLERLARSYGTRLHRIVRGAHGLNELGEHFGAGLYEAELRYLIEAEWAVTAADVLWRRSKLGLRLTEVQAARLAQWLAGAHAERSEAAADTRRAGVRNSSET